MNEDIILYEPKIIIRSLDLLLLSISSFLLFIGLYTINELFLIISLFLIIFLLLRFKSPLITFFCLYIFLQYLVPPIIHITTSSSIVDYLPFYFDAFLYLNLYLIIFSSSYLIFNKLPKYSFFEFENYRLFNGSYNYLLFLSLILFFLCICSDLALFLLGKRPGINPSVNWMNEPLTILTLFKLTLLGFLKNLSDQKVKYCSILFFLILIIFFILAILSGSRFELVILIFTLIYLFKNYFLKRKMTFIINVILCFLLLVMIFPTHMIYRNFDLSIVESFKYVFFPANNKSFFSIYLYHLTDLFLDRLNYAYVLQRIIDYSKDILDYNYYLQNIYGLIPRFVYPDKVTMGIDSNLIGRELLIIKPDNLNTAIGLGVIGESFYKLQYFGLFVALFQGMFFYILDKFNSNKKIILKGLYIVFIFHLSVIDTYSFVFVKFLHIIFIYLIILFMTKKIFKYLR